MYLLKASVGSPAKNLKAQERTYHNSTYMSVQAWGLPRAL
jgi:hypothetical protein